MSSFVIKIIAIISMSLDHFNDAIIGSFTFLQVIGRIAFPLFCFQLVLGYSKTRSIPKYLLRLFITAMLSQWPYIIFLRECGFPYSTNVIFTFVIGLLVICIYDMKIQYNDGEISGVLRGKEVTIVNKISNSEYYVFRCVFYFIKIIMICALISLSIFLKTDYDMWGILLMLFIYICYPFRGEINILGYKISIGKAINIAMFLIGMFIFSFTKYIENWNTHQVNDIIQLVIATFITSFIMLMYNDKKGPGIKYFFYIFYPVQFIILVLLRHILLLH